jgi:D-alanyl-D-alanine dipeptidase
MGGLMGGLRLPCEALGSQADFRRLSSIAGIAVDLRYAGVDNFVGRDLYGDLDCAWLHREAAVGLEAGVAWLHEQHPELRLLVLDALRPHRVQEQLWQHLAGTELRQYLADPARGSIHSFGMAVDVTLLDAQGLELDMGTGFDDLSVLSHPDMEDLHLAQGRLSPLQLANRCILRTAMTGHGFYGIHSEWWHFDFGDKERVRQRYLRIE